MRPLSMAGWVVIDALFIFRSLEGAFERARASHQDVVFLVRAELVRLVGLKLRALQIAVIQKQTPALDAHRSQAAMMMQRAIDVLSLREIGRGLGTELLNPLPGGYAGGSGFNRLASG